MGIAITDLLIELSDPRQYAEFARDPERYLVDRRLPTEDFTADVKEALLSRNVAKIWRYALSTESTDPAQQFNRLTGTLEVNVVVDVSNVFVVVSDEAVDGQGLYVDGNGTFYRAVPAS